MNKLFLATSIIIISSLFLIKLNSPTPKLDNISSSKPLVESTAPPFSLQQIKVGDHQLSLPSTLTIGIYATNLSGPRDLLMTPNNTLLVSVPRLGKIVALRDTNGDSFADEETTLISELSQPHGLALKCQGGACLLYVAETDQVAAYTFTQDPLQAVFGEVLTKLPGGGGHTTRSLLMHPTENKLLIAVGSSCNVCLEKDSRRGSVLAYDFDTKQTATFATGLRNSVFLTTHPKTQEIWATEMGRDQLGDDLPPDEINILSAGRDYGWPYCYGKNIRDTQFNQDKNIRCAEGVNQYPSQIDLQAHSAPLGIAFVPETYRALYQTDLLVAYHGSWNRSQKTGYKIVAITLDNENREVTTTDFISGWLDESSQTVTGRPVAIIFDKQGIGYISDDKAGEIYTFSPNN